MLLLVPVIWIMILYSPWHSSWKHHKASYISILGLRSPNYTRRCAPKGHRRVLSNIRSELGCLFYQQTRQLLSNIRGIGIPWNGALISTFEEMWVKPPKDHLIFFFSEFLLYTLQDLLWTVWKVLSYSETACQWCCSSVQLTPPYDSKTQVWQIADIVELQQYSDLCCSWTQEHHQNAYSEYLDLWCVFDHQESNDSNTNTNCYGLT